MPFRDDLLVPIAGENPSGPNLRYDPIRDEIKEARREEAEIPQGVWKSEVKTANWNRVITLAEDTIAKRSKDLQLSVWLFEAHLRREGFLALAPGFDFLRVLVDTFWDTFHPEIDDGDLEERASILSWVGSKLDGSVRVLPMLRGGLSWTNYRESVMVGAPDPSAANELQQRREKLIAEGKTTPEAWETAVNATPKADCEALQAVVLLATESLKSLITVCDERFGRDSPSFTPMKQAVEDIANTIRGIINRKGGAPAVAPQSTNAPPPPPPAATSAPVYSGPVPAAPQPAQNAAPPVFTSLANRGIDPLDMADAEARLDAICRFLRNNDVYDIAPFLIRRGLRFGQIRYNGPDQIDRKMLEAPPPGLAEELERFYNAHDWDALLAATERAMSLPCGRGWLDVQFYAVRALEAKGQWFAFVADAIRSEVRALVSDLPKLMGMALADGTPTASEETHAWIKAEVLSGAALPVRSAPPPQSSEPVAPPEPLPMAVVLPTGPPPLLEQSAVEPQADEIFEHALADAASGQLAQAIATLSRQLETERSGRKRFVRRVQLAHLLLAGGQSRVALPLLEQIASEIESRNLETWEDCAGLAYPLTLLLQCLNGSPIGQEQREKLFARICQLDPARALSLQT